MHGLFIMVVLRYDFTPYGLTAQKSLDVISVAPKFINISAWGMTRLAHFSLHGPLISKGAAWEKQKSDTFWGQLFTGWGLNRCCAIEVCCDDSMLLKYHMHTVSHCTQSCWPRLWHDLRCLIWILFLWCFYGSSWLGTTSSFRLGLSVLHGSLLTAIDVANIWIQSLYQAKMQVRSQEGQIPQIFWCGKSM